MPINKWHQKVASFQYFNSKRETYIEIGALEKIFAPLF